MPVSEVDVKDLTIVRTHLDLHTAWIQLKGPWSKLLDYGHLRKSTKYENLGLHIQTMLRIEMMEILFLFFIPSLVGFNLIYMK